MSSISLQLVLLFAIAYSQIFGGISCCCLGRTLFAGLSEVSPQDQAGRQMSPISQPSQPVRCAKCAVRQPSQEPSASRSSNPTGQQRAHICEDGQCRCTKLFINANSPSDPVSVKADSQIWDSHASDAKSIRADFTLVSCRFEVPLRFGGRSWQSIACVWKN